MRPALPVLQQQALGTSPQMNHPHTAVRQIKQSGSAAPRTHNPHRYAERGMTSITEGCVNLFSRLSNGEVNMRTLPFPLSLMKRWGAYGQGQSFSLCKQSKAN